MFFKLGDSLGGGPKLIIINYLIIYQYIAFGNIYLGTCGDNWVTEDAEIHLKIQANTMLHVCECCNQKERRES
jgi:hypothetical protein